MTSRHPSLKVNATAVALLATIIVMFGIPTKASAANHAVPPGTTSVDCRSYNGGVKPGDTLTLAGRARGSFKFENCAGTAASPIVIRNDSSESGPLVVTQSGDGFSSECVNCEYVVIDGSAKWAGAPAGACGASISNDGEWRLGTGQCGIVLTCSSGSPQSGLRISGSSKHVTVRGIEIDGNFPKCSWGIGLSINDHKYTPKANEWREGFLISNNYIHNTGRSGIYFGPNQTNASSGDMQLRDNEIANNYVTHTGCDGIKYKSVVAGASSVHHNYVTNTGESNGEHEDGCGANGISLFESGFTDVFSNYVESPAPVADGPGNCIAQSTANLSVNQVATLPVRIYNNVVHNCKGKGISSIRKSTSNPAPVPTIYNNTVVGPTGNSGIGIGNLVKNCTIRSNIVSGTKIAATQCGATQNLTDAIDAQGFMSARDNDFRLTARSPAIDDGGTQCPNVDQAGNERPQGGACDAGAFEFVNGQAAPTPKPSPPGSVVVE